ncbi:MAG TPA: Flp family type IVb pilin [Clostridia bacterium]|nr:Flp family type IVb pilin [Clostridia bacterium]
MARNIRKVLLDDHGQDLAEYAMLIGLIALLVVVGVVGFGGQLAAGYTSMAGRLSAALNP